MKKVISKDGTPIAYDKSGQGPTITLIDGALGFRFFGPMPELAKILSSDFTTIIFDRRGRGDSGDNKPYSVEREIEDIDALIDETGGPAYLYGVSSGACLALEAAIKLGFKVRKLAMYEPPYNSENAALQEWRQYVNQLNELLAANRRGDAVELFMRFVGTPDDQIAGMRQAPIWPIFEAVAHTLAYDAAVTGSDRSVPTERASRVTASTLIMHGGAGFAFMKNTAIALSKAIPNAHFRTLEGQTHNVSPEVIAPVLKEFFRR